VAQVNARLPRTLGDSFIHVSQLTYAVPLDEEPYTTERRPLTPEQRAIGRYVATLIEDGATVQTGIGAIPDAVLAALHDKRDLGIHTEMFSDGVMELVRAGVITGAKKTIHRGKVVAGFLMGSRALYDWVDDNPMVELHPIEYVNDTRVIRQNPQMVAINGALQVDLTGQVCADSIGHHVYSGVGGQMDFMRGAALSPGGKPIIALPATAAGGTLSRLVSALSPGAGVTTTRAHVHYVVTEYGVAHLWGMSLRERAALIAIAHPAFRDELAAEARQLRLL
jgi:acetyl-CoA hydrolase